MWSVSSVTAVSCVDVAGARCRYTSGVWTWLITRPAAEAQQLVAELEKRGVPARALPCIERRFTRLASWRREGPGLIFLTSAAAVEPVCASLEALSSPTPPAFAAVTPATLATLEAAGQKAVVTAPGGSVALAREVAAWLANQPLRWAVLYPTSDLGSEEQREALTQLEEVADVSRVMAYQVTAPTGLPRTLASLESMATGLFFSSPSAVRHFADAVTPAFAPPAYVACFGRSTMTQALHLLPSAWPSPTLVPRERELSQSLEALWK